ncbi:MAG: dihydrodipicolinate synthase family protein [Clostridiales bacterium]|jgi:hypothetical protein|nr:dihydrodipicolinate synthase family protein [Clostridiales bacterium]
MTDAFKKGMAIPAMPLALDERRNFSPKHQRAVLRYYMDAGVGGIAVGVHSTQFAIRDHNLYEPLLDFAAGEINKHPRSILKIAGVCGKTHQALKEAYIAKSLGYDFALLSPGGLAGCSEAYLLERTGAVSEVLPVIGFYLQPAVGGRVLGFSYWKALSQIPNVVGIKCAPFNRYQTIDLARGVAESGRASEIALYTGNDDSIVLDLLTRFNFQFNGKPVEIRFVGGLLGHWGVWVKKAVELLDRIKSLDDINPDSIPSDLLTLGAQITDANAAFFDAANGFKGVIPGIHEVLRRQGIFAGTWCLDPNEKLSPGQLDEIDRVCASYPDLSDDSFVAENLERWLGD